MIDTSEILDIALADWGQTAQVVLTDVTGIFTLTPQRDELLETGIGNYSATFAAKAADLAHAERGSEVRIGTDIWYVIDIKPDGMGGTTLYLSEEVDG